MRAVFQGLSADLTAQIQSNMAGAAAQQSGVGAGAADDVSGKVGDVDHGGRGFAVGAAPTDAKPPPLTADGPRPGRPKTQALGIPSSKPSEVFSPGGTDDEGQSPTGSPPVGGAVSAASRNAAFARFKKDVDDGRALQAVVSERTSHLAELKKSIKVRGESG